MTQDSNETAGKEGMQVLDLRGSTEFMGRRLRARQQATEIAGMQRLAHVFAHRPEMILQELIEVAIDMCGADSAGITIEEQISEGESQFRWIATAGQYVDFRGAVLPRYSSPCGTCLERGQPQLFRVSQVYLDLIGVKAPPVTDGLLIPWRTEETRGTIWVLAHGPFDKFDREDYRLVESLSNFTAIAVRHKQQQDQLMRQASAAAAAAMANELAHEINNPLQSLTQILFLASEGGADAGRFAQQAMADLTRLSALVKKLLSLPTAG